jgi:tyrosyl-tRNA synthetase
MAASTDSKQIKEVLERGVDKIYPSRDFLKEKLKSGEELSLYLGIDPTADSLHIGNGIQLLKLRQFQKLGHKIILLIGDFTGMVGDPTEKDTARDKLSRSEVLENCKEYKQQAANILDFEGDNPAELKYNSDWLGDMNFADVIDLASNFTVNKMMERDMFQRRQEQEDPIFVHEFMYPMMQAYDCVAMDVEGEVGGTDQTFNMLAGRDLMKKLKDKEKFVLTTELLAPTGEEKMSKSVGDSVDLSDDPEDVYGKVMRWSDESILEGFELATTISLDELHDLEEQLQEVDNPMPIKKRLAFEVTKTFLGEEAAHKGQDYFKRVIQQGKKPKKTASISPSSYDILTILVESELVDSKTQARNLIDQGAVKLGEEKIDDYHQEIESGETIQKGSRFFIDVE